MLSVTLGLLGWVIGDYIDSTHEKGSLGEPSLNHLPVTREPMNGFMRTRSLFRSL